MEEQSYPESVDAAEVGGVKRRTIVKGAAWSIPVVAMAMSAPLAAASAALRVEFVGGPYASDNCQQKPIQVRVLDQANNPVAGVAVTLSFENPAYRWNDSGTQETIVTTGADGTATVENYTGTIAASSSGIAAAVPGSTASSVVTFSQTGSSIYSASPRLISSVFTSDIVAMTYSSSLGPDGSHGIYARALAADGTLYTDSGGGNTVWKTKDTGVTLVQPFTGSYSSAQGVPYGDMVYAKDNVLFRSNGESISTPFPSAIRQISYSSVVSVEGGKQTSWGIYGDVLLADGSLYRDGGGGTTVWTLKDSGVTVLQPFTGDYDRQTTPFGSCVYAKGSTLFAANGKQISSALPSPIKEISYSSAITRNDKGVVSWGIYTYLLLEDGSLYANDGGADTTWKLHDTGVTAMVSFTGDYDRQTTPYGSMIYAKGGTLYRGREKKQISSTFPSNVVGFSYSSLKNENGSYGIYAYALLADGSRYQDSGGGNTNWKLLDTDVLAIQPFTGDFNRQTVPYSSAIYSRKSC